MSTKQLNFVFTGILEKLTRAAAEEMVTDFGHKVSNTVRRNTDYLITGIRPGSKLTEAEHYSVKVINEAQFLAMMRSLVRFIAPAERPKVEVPPMSALGPDTISGQYFLVGKIDWQYNDEYYHRGYNDDDGVVPTKLFRRRSAALAEKATLEKKSFGGCDLMHYTQERGLTDFFKGRDYDYFRELYYQYLGKDLPADASDFEYGDKVSEAICPNLAKLPLERFINITRFLKFGFYEIHEVAVGD